MPPNHFSSFSSTPSTPQSPPSMSTTNNIRPNRPKILARLEGTVFVQGKDLPLRHVMRTDQLILGRSDPQTISTHPFRPAKKGVHLGLGVSTKLSREHARIDYNPETDVFILTCIGRNGVFVRKPGHNQKDIRINPESQPFQLISRSIIKISDAKLSFVVPVEMKRAAPSVEVTDIIPSSNIPTNHSTKKRKRREWIKAEHSALRAQMMRYGYGRWNEIISATNGRLSERQPSDIIPVARKFVARCHIHARPGVEQKALMEILRHEATIMYDGDEEQIQKDIEQLLSKAKEEAEPNEKRKYVRWARKLRLLSRLQDVHDHSSLERLRAGELRVFTPPPALYWTSQDDADLILGSFKHGYGATEAMRQDSTLGFHGRYAKAIPTKKVSTPSKPEKLPETNKSSEDDEDDDEDPDEDEDERHGLNATEHLDDENTADQSVTNPKKKVKLHDQSGKSHNVKTSVNGNTSADVEMPDDADIAMDDDSDMSPERSLDAKNGSTDDGDNNNKTLNTKENSQNPPEKPKKKTMRLVPKRGPRIGNEDGFNNPEDAEAAAKSMADENGLVPFPGSEALMRRLKSIINSCAKEYDRDQREIKKKELAASRAEQRKSHLAAKKAEKEAEKTRMRAEKRIAKSQPFTKREAVEFEKALANFGINYKQDCKTIDWDWFRLKVEGFEAKYDETLNSAYVELLSEAHRITDLAAAKEDEDFDAVDQINGNKPASAVFSTLTLERAEKLIERLQFFRSLRGEILSHPKIQSILRGVKKSKDLPVWWKSQHDRCLLIGVDKYGFNGWEAMGNDRELSFYESMNNVSRTTDAKAPKRASMPKSSAGIKRAFALVRYFRSRANDPHFEFYNQNTPNSDSGTGNMAIRASTSKQEQRISKVEPMINTDNSLQLSEERLKPKVKLEPAAVPSGTGRPRTLRETIIPIPRDENGILILPANLGDGLFLLNLGDVVQGRSRFCQNGIVFPIGFRTVRLMSQKAFLCEILASSDRQYPEFRVSVLEDFDENAKDEDEMWKGQRLIETTSNIIKLWMLVANQELNKNGDQQNRVTLASGPERYGLYEPTILYHIQKLPSAKFVDGFEFRDFSTKGGGSKIEPPVGIYDAMMKALDVHLEDAMNAQPYDGIMSDDERDPREGRVLASEKEMSIPEEWILEHGGPKRKFRRKSNS